MQPIVTMDKQWCTFNVLTLSTIYYGYKTSKICLKLQIPYYHPLNLWLQGATNSNHGQTMMHLQCFWHYQPYIMGIRTSKICLKLQIPYYHSLNLWLLGATSGYQGQKSDAPSMFWDYQQLIMGIRLKNMSQTSNSLLSPTRSMVARGNQW